MARTRDQAGLAISLPVKHACEFRAESETPEDTGSTITGNCDNRRSRADSRETTLSGLFVGRYRV